MRIAPSGRLKKCRPSSIPILQLYVCRGTKVHCTPEKVEEKYQASWPFESAPIGVTVAALLGMAAAL
jgi:hypothetical protein